MNAAAIVAVSVLLAAGAAAGVSIALAPSPAPAPAPPAGVTAAAFEAAVQRLEQAQQQLQARAAAPIERTAVPAFGEADVAAAVQAYLAKHQLPAAAAGEADADPAARKAAVARTFADLKAGGTVNYWRNQEAWKRALDNGEMEDLVGMFEAEAKANPNDPEAQMRLADAYLAWISLDQSKGPTLGMESDKALDRVLALDSRHWQARFTKAVSYSFWPDFTGKPKEALAHFDTLVQQQATMAPTPEQAQTYLFYGNMLDQAGQGDKAREIWQQGLARHPDDAELRQKLQH